MGNEKQGRLGEMLTPFGCAMVLKKELGLQQDMLEGTITFLEGVQQAAKSGGGYSK